MNDRTTLNAIAEEVTGKVLPTRERFLDRYDREDDRLLDETMTAGAVAQAAPENVIEPKQEEKLEESFDEFTHDGLADRSSSPIGGFSGTLKESIDSCAYCGQECDPFDSFEDEETGEVICANCVDEEEFEDYYPQVVNESTNPLLERINLRKQANTLYESASKEDLENEDSEINLVRYSLQKFANGGTRLGMELTNTSDLSDGVEGGPTAYEKWRRDKIDARRKDRVEQENTDRKSSFASPKTTTIGNSKLIDSQLDDFLHSWLRDQKKLGKA